MAWDPSVYMRFSSPRLRPALDLLAQVPLGAPRRIWDLGCGPGNVTRLLAARWPGAAVTGLDSSAEMLAEAERHEDTRRLDWVRGDLAHWTPPEPADLIFSNAALHWLDDHETLFPRLLTHLAPGGVLAVQLPRNHAAPSHTCVTEAALAGPWRARLEPLLRPHPVAAPSFYYDLLAPRAAVDIWETEYQHALEGDDPVVQWTLGTTLRPLLDALEEPERGDFLADYARRVAAAYPPQPDGRTLFAFRRLFMVAKI